MSEENTETIVDPALTAGDLPPADPPQPDPVDPPEPPPRMIPADVLVREVTPLRAKNRELEGIVDEHRRKLREAEDLIARLQRPTDPNAPPSPPHPRQADPQSSSQADIERAAVELNFKRDAARVFQSGAQAFGQKGFQDACNLMDSFGLNNAEFVSSIMEIGGVENAHAIFHAIAQEPEKVAALQHMTSVQRAREITRIADKMNAKPAAAPAEPAKPAQPPARTVSRAPNPPPRVDPSASQVVEWWSDKASDEDFSKGWEENMARRRGARR